MKKLILFLTLLFVGISANAQYTPSNSLNYVKLLKTPPVGSVEDSVLVYDGSDSFVKMRPSSELITKATPTKSGVVKTDILEADPIVYTKTTLDSYLKLKEYLSTGLLKNGLITINADPTKFNVSAGIGVISNFDDPDNPVSSLVSFPAFTGVTPTYLNTGNITYIAVTKTPSVQLVMQATPFTPVQRRDLIELGAVIHSNLTTINVVNNISAPSNAIGNQLHDFIEAVGALNITGNKYSANGANLSLNKSAGSIFKFGVNFANDWKNPHQLAQGAGTSLTFRYRTQNGTEGSDVTAINPAVYDLSNVLTAVPNNKFTIQTVVMFQTGLTRILYGQQVYDDLATAKNAIFTRSFNMESNAKENGIIRAYIIVKNTTTSLQNTVDSEIIEAQKFGGVASGGVALTLSNIVSALGYTPENVANKQNSLTIDGTGTKYVTVDAVNKVITYTTPEEYGAVGNGVADDKTAIQNAINSGKMVLLNGNYFTSGTITISNKTTIYGNGKINTTADLPIFDIKSNDIVIDGIRFEGNGRGTATNYVTTRPLQIGISLEGVVDVTVYKNIRLSNLYFYNLGGAGIKIAANKNATNGGSVLISNCSADLCYIGYYLAERGEYNSFSNIKSYSCEYGMYFLGGNNPVSNPNMEINRTGMYFASGGVNPGHSSIIGGSINHSLDKGIDVNGFNFGQSFIGVQLYASDIYITGSDNIKFTGCDIRSTNIIVTTSTNTSFQDCSFIITPTVFTGLTLCTFSSTKWLLTPPSGFTDTNKQPLNVVKKLVVNTGTSGANLDIANQNNGSVDFSNSSGANAVPTITGKSNDRTGLTFIAATNDVNSNPDFSLNVRENDNTDFTTLTSAAFRFSRFGTTLMDMLRNGNTTFTGNISAPLFTGSASLTGNSTAPTPTAGDNDTSIPTTAFVTGAIATAKPYKVYTAILSQTGTSAPVATVLQNTLGGTPVWTRTSTGLYVATLTGFFTANKTALFASVQYFGVAVSPLYTGIDTVSLQTFITSTGVLSDNINGATIEIRVYN